MTQIIATVLFDKPQQELATELAALLDSCKTAWILAGFATVEGVALLTPQLRSSPARLAAFIVGAATQRAFDALDDLIDAGVGTDRLYIHLGHSRPTSPGAKYRFYRYHPMVHSKIYLFDMPGGRSVAIIGSHNVTGFALMGLNAEAAVRLDGPSEHEEFRKVRSHIESCRSQAVPYTPALKEAYTWWNLQFLDGLKQKTEDRPRDDERKQTLVVLCEAGTDGLPSRDDVVYLEVPQSLRRTVLGAEVHIYAFRSLPASPFEALATLSSARLSFWARTLGLEDERGGVELQADWEITTATRPVMQRVHPPFRPKVSSGMQQVRVKLGNSVFDRFEYMFDKGRTAWIPQFAADSVVVGQSHAAVLAELEVVPPEDKEWSRVVGLVPAGQGDQTEVMVQQYASPDAGRYILLSLRRRKKNNQGTR